MLNLVLCFGRFLGVGQILLEIVEIEPEVDLVVQRVLRTGFQSMKATTLALHTAEGKVTKTENE